MVGVVRVVWVMGGGDECVGVVGVGEGGGDGGVGGGGRGWESRGGGGVEGGGSEGGGGGGGVRQSSHIQGEREGGRETDMELKLWVLRVDQCLVCLGGGRVLCVCRAV